mmetsp:Transcript_1224/g.1613  ORF Transcript_1224/g.1613 Transcript_1224/m.1613 type:complete len:129 (+) Transcript_1224:431-817(+)|eukprot:CAMPEP_0185577924 /NCGR_PEP_ID=MMETSP0434-20130131/11480_1 /TAXON_ID=626734 ORGANISM="Favella taraikaensis, Strain Fe Narragansett Bay" /NCGR_SAMPLE_ID=MMETSP0434 /ASSEMBLY_ACC=CAM_ASM_000379 /LENGTH=128 /DNA_ID=CAMNT_0028195621 /DNA_START=417 /DNA_END=803 /DNA_ORIENTATION=-
MTKVMEIVGASMAPGTVTAVGIAQGSSPAYLWTDTGNKLDTAKTVFDSKVRYTLEMHDSKTAAIRYENIKLGATSAMQGVYSKVSNVEKSTVSYVTLAAPTPVVLVVSGALSAVAAAGTALSLLAIAF